jgi:PAS domain S-box-containing protein
VSEWIVIAGLFICGLVLLLRVIRLQDRLQASREAFAVLSQRAPVGILMSDADGSCTYANDTWCELSGLSLAETLGYHWRQVVHPDDREAVIEKWDASVRRQSPYVNEVRLVRPDGSIRHVLASGCPTHDDHGRVSGFIGTVLDITGRRAAEREAREKESLLRTLVDHSSAAIYLKDTTGRYLMVNRRHIEIWPVMEDFQPGTTPFDWFPADVARAFIASDAEVWRTAQTLTFEESIQQDGERRTFLTVKFPVFSEAGEVTAVGGISADITDLERARRELGDREHLLRGLIEVQENEKQLLCHEFHDGLIQYAVGSKMLLEALGAGQLPEAARATVDAVIDCLARGIEDGRRVIRGIRPAALDDLGLRAALEELADDLREAGVEVDATFESAIDDTPRRLQTTIYRVVQESLNNARKHSGSERVSVTVTRSDGQIMVQVADVGRGFDPAEAGAAGFGLVGVRERVRLAGGECRVESGVDQGTRISVSLPLCATKPVPA